MSAPLVAAIAAAALAAAPPGPARAQDAPAAAPAPAAAKPKPKPKDTDRICWRETPTGSHLSKTVCSTRGELELRQRQDQDALGQRGRRGANPFGASN
jgi:hypothetical protein